MFRDVVVFMPHLVHVVVCTDLVIELFAARVELSVWLPMRACKKLRRVWLPEGMVRMVACPPCGAWWAMRTSYCA